jgi:hypothetical protein
MTKTLAAACAAFALILPAGAHGADLNLDPLGRVALGGAEIGAFDARSDRAFVTDAGANALHIVDLSDPASPDEIETVDLSPYGAGPNSVAVSRRYGGLVAVAVEGDPKTDRGSVVLFDRNGDRRGKPIPAGALPDMLTFTPDGRTLLVANEGEPNDLYTTDPVGSVTVIGFERGIGNPRVRTAGFAGVPLDGPVRLFGFNNPSPPQDLEPEYIATDGSLAWVTLQENNAIGLLDLESAEFTKVKGLGFKDFGLVGMDASDRDNGLGSTLPSTPGQLVDNIFERPGVLGMYLPDALAAFRSGGETLLVSANEGDSRVYPPADIPGGPDEGDVFSEEIRVNGLAGAGFTIGGPLVGKTGNADLGRLTVTRPSTVGVPGLTQTSGTVESVYVLGGRSLSVWNADATLRADTGDDLERQAFVLDKANFNKSNSADSLLDDRSDNKGPEPEGVAVGVVDGTTYAFLGSERSGSIYAYDLSDPDSPLFSGHANTRPADLGPEGVAFVPSGDSPSGAPLVLIANEISGTLNVLEVTVEP